jgi:hypothetical protein
MPRTFPPVAQTVTIADSAATSDAEPIGLGGRTIVGIYTPSGLTGTTLTFTVCDTLGGTYVALNDPDTGAALSLVVAASKYYAIDPIIFIGPRYVKVVSGSTESGGDIITLMVAPVVVA